MKPAHRRYSERDSPDWSPRTMSPLAGRRRWLHIWSPWYPVTSTRRARCASAPRKYTSSPLASAARNGSSGPGGASGPRQASRARRRSRTPRAWAIAPPLSGAPLLDGATGRAQILRQAREGRLEEPSVRREVAEIAAWRGLGTLAQRPAVPDEVVEVGEAHGPRRGGDAAGVARQAVADRFEVRVIPGVGRVHVGADGDEQAGERVGHAHPASHLVRVQPVHGRAGRNERDAPAAAARSGAEHEIGLVESRPGELAVPYRLAEPVGRRLDIGAVEYLDCRVAAVTARQPGERWPAGDGRVAEVHASFLGRSFEAARGRRRAVAWHPVTIHRRGADLAGPQHRGQALAEAPSGPEEQLVREIEPDPHQHGRCVGRRDRRQRPARHMVAPE